ncbi:EVE domain-containing protein [Spongiibacter sp. KMU-166]|uniref:EVE domain-containing protein n=1 Tax=Spongiibacter thalassae TaxID=2721624 RepID=A0ABX1GH33_9GAMM|nr:EVE domain-containing protein [Spongiibacter thalassae]NKI18226.1 EVE domain-containing protein [Spongiibacter thalassae]
MQYWLMKSEPDTFGIDDLAARKNATEHWDGVRNYQARNFMRDRMKVGDQILFYHSACKTPGVAGIARVVREAYPDHTARNPESKYYDPKASDDDPRWYMVDVQFQRKLSRLITLKELKGNPALDGMALLKKGSRLSIMPVEEAHWRAVLAME